MLLLPNDRGRGFIGDIPRGGLGEEEATLDRLLALSVAMRFSIDPICGSVIVWITNQAIEVPSPRDLSVEHLPI